jgi:TPR repeat protein
VLFVDRPDDDGHVKDLVDVLEIRKYLDRASYGSLDSQAKRIKLADLIKSGAVTLAKTRGWDASPFERAYDKIVATGVSLGGPIGKPIASPDKTRRAQMEYTYEYAIDVYVNVVQSAENRSERVLFAKLIAGLDLIATLIGPMKWTSNDQLEIQLKNKNDKWIVKLGDKPQSEFITERAARDDPHGLYDLGMNYVKGYLVPKDLERARYWLRRAAERGYSRAPSALAQIANMVEEP